jgi:hypothetical protein
VAQGKEGGLISVHAAVGGTTGAPESLSSGSEFE